MTIHKGNGMTEHDTPPPLDLAELRKLADEAWPEPWEKFGNTVTLKLKGGIVHTIVLPGDHQTLAFIAASRTVVPELIDRLDRAEAALAAAEMHRAHALAVADRMDLDDMTVYAYMIRRALGVEAKEPTGET